MTIKNELPQLENTFKAVKQWHAQAEKKSRTLENLLGYLKQRKNFLPFKPRKKDPKSEWPELSNINLLVRFLQSKKLDFVLTPKLVDALLRPGVEINCRYISWPGYQFFIEHYHEHPFLEKLIRKGISGPLRLRVIPVFPADGNLTTWLFDPWAMRVYKFSFSWDNAGSICEEYRGDEHPFSEEYQSRVKMFKKRFK